MLPSKRNFIQLVVLMLICLCSHSTVGLKVRCSSIKRFATFPTPLYSSASSSGSTEVDPTPNQQIDLLYDSECPICAMEVEFLRKRDFDQKIKFTDLASPEYNPVEHGNVQFQDGMRKIRAVLPDKTVIVGKGCIDIHPLIPLCIVNNF